MVKKYMTIKMKKILKTKYFKVKKKDYSKYL